MTSTPDFLHEEYTIDTPENVIFGYDVADIGSRFIGAFIDSIILSLTLFMAAIVLTLILELVVPQGANLEEVWSTADWATGIVLAVYTLLNFVIIWGYYIAFELLWNGQTPGKRIAGTRVIQTNGNPAMPTAIIVRNLVRIVDFLPWGYGLGVIVMFCNRQARRLGDFAAGTLVVRERDDVKLDDLTALHDAGDDAWNREVLLRTFPNVDRLSYEEYSLIREVLARHEQQAANEMLLRRLATVIADKLEYVGSTYRPPRRFLEDMAAAYRAAMAQQTDEQQQRDRENSEERTWKNS